MSLYAQLDHDGAFVRFVDYDGRPADVPHKRAYFHPVAQVEGAADGAALVDDTWMVTRPPPVAAPSAEDRIAALAADLDRLKAELVKAKALTEVVVTPARGG